MFWRLKGTRARLDVLYMHHPIVPKLPIKPGNRWTAKLDMHACIIWSFSPPSPFFLFDKRTGERQASGPISTSSGRGP